MMRNGFAPLREEGGGGNHYLHCVWALGPRPGARPKSPLVTNAADGMHMTGSDPGPDIENCDFQGVFLDDCIAIHGGFKTIKAASGTAVTLDGGAGDIQVGEPARISDQKGFFAEGTVMAIKDNGDKTTTVTLDKDYGVPAAAKMSNPLRRRRGLQDHRLPPGQHPLTRHSRQGGQRADQEERIGGLRHVGGQPRPGVLLGRGGLRP